MTNFSLTTISPPAIDPVSLAMVKLHTHIDNDIEDTVLTKWIQSAVKQAENFQGRSYISRSYCMSFDSFPALPLSFPRAPLISVESIAFYDYQNTETILPLSDFYVDTESTPGRICHAYGKSWPSVTLRTISAVKINFTAGYGDSMDDVPPTVQEAIMLYCAYRNENRADESEGLPKGVMDILAPERLWNT